LFARIALGVDVFEANRPDRRHLRDVLTGFCPVEMMGLAGQDDHGTWRIRFQLRFVELIAPANVENTGHDGVD
jgi:hypothetical protein